ncbi:hypothetical protein BDZ91DRAFT_723068 [Kalaharituber pfeilii]|nr:hypothetical protein BDZ91DRAFT_723068 [Kalaharituber pfeilii]
MSQNHSSSVEKGKTPVRGAATDAQSIADTSQPASSVTDASDTFGSGILGGIAESSSRLLNSLLQPAPSEVGSAINTTLSPKGQSSSSAAAGSANSHYWTEVHGSMHSTWSQEHPYSPMFRTHAGSSVEEEYQAFGEGQTSNMHVAVAPFAQQENEREFTAGWSSGHATTLAQPQPQENILDILSSPSLTEEIWKPKDRETTINNISGSVHVPNVHSAQIAEFLAMDDIVQFLSRDDTVYTEEVWGNMLGLLHVAQKEVKDSSGKSEEERENSAVERLKSVRNHLRSRL